MCVQTDKLTITELLPFESLVDLVLHSDVIIDCEEDNSAVFKSRSGKFKIELNVSDNEISLKLRDGHTDYRPSTKELSTVEDKVSYILKELGIPTNLKGYRYLMYAIHEVYKNPEIISRMTKELYPVVAKHYNTTTSRVERDIRHSVELAWCKSPKKFYELIGYSGTKKPYNAELMSLVADNVFPEIFRDKWVM